MFNSKEREVQSGTALEDFCSTFSIHLQTVESRLSELLEGLSNKDVSIKKLSLRHNGKDQVHVSADQQGRLVITVSSEDDNHTEKGQCAFLLTQSKGGSTWTIHSFKGGEMSCIEQCKNVFRTIVVPVLRDDCQPFTELEVNLFEVKQAAHDAGAVRVRQARQHVSGVVAATAGFVRRFNADGVVSNDPDDVYN